MRFDIITIFPKIFDSYFSESIIKRARAKGLIDIHTHNLRDFSSDKKHHKVDDRPFGGGPGMVLQIEPIYKAVESLQHKSMKAREQKSKKAKTRVILFSAKGKQFDQKMAKRLSRYDRLIMICGRYEGVDERVAKYIADEEVSVGPYILTGGEVPAMIVVDAVSRLIPGTLGKAESIEETRSVSSQILNSKFKILNSRVASYPVYTRPEVFSPKKGVSWRVPGVLLSGHQSKVEKWRKQQIERTIKS